MAGQSKVVVPTPQPGAKTTSKVAMSVPSRAPSSAEQDVAKKPADAAMEAVGGTPTKTYSLLGVEFDPAKPEVNAHLNPWIAGILVLVAVAYFLFRHKWQRRLKSFEIAEAELGIGAGKITLKPNEIDRQVAYQIWVELSTRKIGLPIDLQNDVVAEIYDSWHQFFTVTRELIKSVPVSRAADDSTRKIINLSIEVLNEGLRPHLTLWQARFRTWYDQQLKVAASYEEPQDLQAKFPRFADLSNDLARVNQHLIAYRAAMRQIVYQA